MFVETLIDNILRPISLQQPSNTTPSRLLSCFNQVLVDLDPLHLVKYLKLVEVIISDKSIPPTVTRGPSLTPRGS